MLSGRFLQAGADRPYHFLTAAVASALRGDASRAAQVLAKGSPIGETGLTEDASLARGLIAARLGQRGAARRYLAAVPTTDAPDRAVSARALADEALEALG